LPLIQILALRAGSFICLHDWAKGVIAPFGETCRTTILGWRLIGQNGHSLTQHPLAAIGCLAADWLRLGLSGRFLVGRTHTPDPMRTVNSR